MYRVVSSRIFIDMIEKCRPFCIADVDMDTGNARLIDGPQLEEIVPVCTEIRCYQDDLLKRYDLYYERDRNLKVARVLLDAG